MSELSHRQARRLIQQPELATDEQAALAQHLQGCGDCAAYARMHRLLAKQLTLDPARSHIPAAQQAAIYNRVAQNSRWSQVQQSFAAAGMLAALALVILAAWYLIQFQGGGGVSSTTATAMPSPAVLQPTHTPTVQPTPTATPELTPQKPIVRWELQTIPAPSLANSMLGEPTEQPIVVYLPPSYDTTSKRYPVVYLLPDQVERPDAPNSMDRSFYAAALTSLVQDGRFQEMILVIPNGQTVTGLTSFYVNSSVNGNWEDFIVKDLVAYVDSHYRTLPEPRFRGLTGNSLGGFGALNLAFQHPDVFSAVYAVNPELFAPDGLEQSNLVSSRLRHDVIGLINELSGLTRAKAHTRYLDFVKNNLDRTELHYALSYGSAFAPNADLNAPYFDYAYRNVEERASDEVWRRWEDGVGDIAGKIAAYSRRQPKLNAIALAYDASLPDQGMKDGVEFLADQLSQAGIPYMLSRNEDLPGFFYRSLHDQILPFFAQNMVSN